MFFLAHGGTTGAIVETATALLIGAVLVAAWIRSRAESAEQPVESDEDDDKSLDA
jgi:hypothetical protein